MSSFFKFASIAFPEKYGYAFDSSQWSSMKSSETHQYYRQFETYGDGLVQHSGDWSVTFEYLADYLFSLAAAMQGNEELLEAVSYTFRKSPGDDLIAFAASVVWKESDRSYDKRRYFSTELRKIGNRTKEHDKRYFEIRDSHDGSRSSIHRLCLNDWASMFEAFQVAEAVKVWCDAQSKHIPHGPAFPEFFGGDFRKQVSLRNALQTCRYIAEAYDRRRWATNNIENYQRNLERASERASASESIAS